MVRRIPPWVKFNPIYRDIWRRLHLKNQNFLGIFCGATGTGKSFAANKVAWDLDRAENFSPRYSLDKCVFLPSDFLDLVRKKMPKGSFIVWDELGVEANARKWYSLKNLLISYVTQTFRFKNYGVLYTVPALSFIDKQVRLLFHAYIEMKDIYIKKKRSVGFWKWLDFNPKNGTVYYKNPRYFLDGRKLFIERVSFALPPRDLIEEYEVKKRNMINKWYGSYHKQLALMESLVLQKDTSNKKEKPLKLYKELKSDIKLLKSVMDLKKGRVHAGKLMIKFEMNKDKAYALAKLLNDDIEAGVVNVV